MNKSSPELIRETVQMSKKVLKSLGTLYKRLVRLNPMGFI